MNASLNGQGFDLGHWVVDIGDCAVSASPCLAKLRLEHPGAIYHPPQISALGFLLSAL